MAIKLDNPYWRAKSAELISYVYDATFYEEEGAKMSKEAADYYLKAGKILNHRYSLCDLGLSYANLSQTERAIDLEDSIFKIAMSNTVDSSLAKYALSNKFYIQVKSECFMHAFESQKRLREMNYSFNIKEKALINSVTLGLKQYVPDSVPREIVEASYSSIQEKIENWKFLIQYAKVNNDFKTAQIYTDSLLNLQNLVVGETLKQSVINSLLKESELETDREHNHAQSLKIIVIIVTLSAFLVLLLIWWVFSYRIKLKNSMLECKMNEVIELTRKFNEQANECSNLHSQLSTKNETIEKQIITLNKEIAANSVLNSELNESVKSQEVLIKDIELLFRNQWQILNDLCREYFDAPSTKNSISFETRLNRELQHLNSPQSLKKIEDTLNRYLCNVMRRLRAQCPELRDDDIRFIVFSYSGFSPRAICLLLNISLPNYYNRKSRISRRILKSGAEDAQEFIERL